MASKTSLASPRSAIAAAPAGRPDLEEPAWLVRQRSRDQTPRSRTREGSDRLSRPAPIRLRRLTAPPSGAAALVAMRWCPPQTAPTGARIAPAHGRYAGRRSAPPRRPGQAGTDWRFVPSAGLPAAPPRADTVAPAPPLLPATPGIQRGSPPQAGGRQQRRWNRGRQRGAGPPLRAIRTRRRSGREPPPVSPPSACMFAPIRAPVPDPKNAPHVLSGGRSRPHAG